MMGRLSRLPTHTDEVKVPDFTLLSPADQDRANELMKLMGSTKEEVLEADDALVSEFWSLIEGLPWLGSDEPEQGPIIVVPGDLAGYWIWKASKWKDYSFDKLSKVQTLRFIELCRKYGYDPDDADAETLFFKRCSQLKERMIPLADWSPKDRTEMTEFLDIAATAPA